MLTRIVSPHRCLLKTPSLVKLSRRNARQSYGRSERNAFDDIVSNSLFEYRVLTGSSILLALAVPSYFYMPSDVTDILVMLATPLHTYVGLYHVIDDYLPYWPAERISFLVAFLIFFAMFKLYIKGTGVTYIISELWKKEEQVNTEVNKE